MNLEEATQLALQGKLLKEDYVYITQKDGYGLTGDQNGYHIVNLSTKEIEKDLGDITKEQALADFDDYIK